MTFFTQNLLPRVARLIARSAILIAPLCLFVSCGGDDDPAGPAAPYADTELQVQTLINQHRAGMHPALAALALQDVISTEARKHSEAMASGAAAFSHDGFEARVAAISSVLKVLRAGENIAMNRGYSDPASQAVTGWLNSPPHRDNIEGDYTHTGIGVAKSADGSVYFTQIFVKLQ
jgi:uncharacterized protein YkwD